MVADWDGQGLPPIAAERARRAAAGGAWTSLLTAPAAAGLQVAGFEPVGVFAKVGRKFDRYWDVAWFQRPLKLEVRD